MAIKISTLVLAICFFFKGTYAQRTVALHSSSVSVFSGVNPLADAYNAAQNGDTLYIPGGAFAAPSLIDKRLYIFGAGYHPDSTQATNPTLITGNFNLGENSDNTLIEGVQFANQINAGYNVSASFISFKRCRINGGLNYAGTGSTSPSLNNAFIECIIIGDISLNNLSNSSILNSIIQNRIFDSKSNTFKNNIFLHIPSSGYDAVLHRPYYNEFSNNIFMSSNGSYIIYDSNDGNLFINNLFTATTPLYGANSIATGNYINIASSSLFVNQNGTAFNYADNYHLQNPSLYLGSDAAQVGIFGGNFPFKAGSVPINPHIGSKTIAPQTSPNGELQINIRVNAQNN